MPHGRRDDNTCPGPPLLRPGQPEPSAVPFFGSFPVVRGSLSLLAMNPLPATLDPMSEPRRPPTAPRFWTKRPATYEDVLDAPEDVRAELIDGVLYCQASPATPHAYTAGGIGMSLGPPFQWGRGGPGGRHILAAPEVHLLDGQASVIPDLAGWRRERMPTMPEAAYLSLVPDWICEVLSPSTAKYDRFVKAPLYARCGVQWLWLADPLAQTLEVLRLGQGGLWIVAQAFTGTDAVSAEPFDAVPLELALLWIGAAEEPARAGGAEALGLRGQVFLISPPASPFTSAFSLALSPSMSALWASGSLARLTTSVGSVVRS